VVESNDDEMSGFSKISVPHRCFNENRKELKLVYQLVHKQYDFQKSLREIMEEKKVPSGVHFVSFVSRHNSVSVFIQQSIFCSKDSSQSYDRCIWKLCFNHSFSLSLTNQ
jgi:hypothetical protein